MERLQKYLAQAGIASRRACEKLITDGRVTVNGAMAVLGMSVEEDDRIEVDGTPVSPEKKQVVIMLYKPRGVVSTSSDPQGRPTVQQYVQDIPLRLYNIGRLDLNSEGLLLLTNDGELCNKMTHPRYKVDKTYYAVCDGRLTAEQAARLTNGIRLEDGMTAPAVVNLRSYEHEHNFTLFDITIHEGRNRQVRRMCDAIGYPVRDLKRIKLGPLTLSNLGRGKFRELSEGELASLKKAAKL